MKKSTVTVGDLADQVSFLEREVESLKGTTKAPTAPLYKNIPVIVSITALLFSFGTTYVSYERTKQQDIHALRAELRNLLQRLSSIPKDDVEFKHKYFSTPATVALLSGLIAQENSLLARQAAEIIRRLPKEQVSTVEYTSVGRALASIDNETAQVLLSRGAEIATSWIEEANALRTHANLLFTMGKSEEGRVLYRQALELKTKYKNFDPMTHVQTELAWATAEHAIGAREQVQERVKSVDDYVEALSAGPIKEIVKNYVAQHSVFFRGPPRVVPILPMPTTPTTASPAIPSPSIPAPALPEATKPTP